MPESFRFAPFWQTQAELWVPLDLHARRTDRPGRSLRVFARLANGVTLDAARAEIRVLNDRLVQAHPDTNRGLTTGVALLSEKATRRVQPMILATFAMAAVVLLIACANVTTLTIVRSLGRTRELAVRSALGAGRGRMVRLLLAEGLLLGVASALVGLGIATAAIKALAGFLPADALPPYATIGLAPPVAAFAMMAAPHVRHRRDDCAGMADAASRSCRDASRRGPRHDRVAPEPGAAPDDGRSRKSRWQ